ncbi:MAG: ATP-dependent helicase [Vulcanimicrobiota bacterium]
MFPGPDELGRGIVVRPGGAVPPGWEAHPRLRVTADPPPSVLSALSAHWLERRRLVVELELAEAALLERPKRLVEPYELEPDFEFVSERLFFLVWANNYDLLGPAPVWRLSRAAARLGAHPSEQADCRVQGLDLWLDGGPRQPLSLPSVHRESLALGRLTVQPRPRRPQELAPDQLAAVEHKAGPARIIAPAGSGKTRVLTARLRHLLVDRGVESELVTAVAYNRRAAQELRHRTRDFEPRVATLHALGYAICRHRGGAQLLEARHIRGLLSRLVEPPREYSRDPLGPYLEALSLVRMGLRQPAQVEASRTDIPGFARAFERYRERLRQQGAIDHDEQIYGAIEYLLASPEARDWARKACRHLLVDEFQDLTPAQLLLVRLLSAPAYQVFGVGDDDQVIYGYAGASPKFLVNFEAYFPGASGYALEVNYRCPPAITTAASHLLSRNRQRVKKTILSPPEQAAGEFHIELAPPAEMALRAVRWVQGQLASRPPEDLALLTRVNATLLPLQLALFEAGLATTAPLDVGVLERTGIRTALAYLRAAYALKGRLPTTTLLESLRRPSRKLRRVALEPLEARADWSLSEVQQLAAGWLDWEREGFQDYRRDLKQVHRLLHRGGVGPALEYVRLEVGLAYDMDSLDRDSGWAGSHNDDLQSLVQLASLHPHPASFEEWLRASLTASREQRGRIRLSSIHRVKGLEWPAVLLYAANNGLMPHRLAEDKEEERRVFHVAITRARSQLLILANQGEASPFLKQLEPPRPPKNLLLAEPGHKLKLPGGLRGQVVSLQDDGVLVALEGGGKMVVAYGSTVKKGKKTRVLIRP